MPLLLLACPDSTNPDSSLLGLPSWLLGGVLKGETRSGASSCSGASVVLPEGSIEAGFAGIFGFPARLMGGGTGGADEAWRSKTALLRGSVEGLGRTGVLFLLGILSFLGPLPLALGKVD